MELTDADVAYLLKALSVLTEEDSATIGCIVLGLDRRAIDITGELDELRKDVKCLKYVEDLSTRNAMNITDDRHRTRVLEELAENLKVTKRWEDVVTKYERECEQQKARSN